VIWADYLVAVLVGCVGMLGLSELTVDVVTLNTQAYEVTLAMLILNEMATLFWLGAGDTTPLSAWCAVLPDAVREAHCDGLREWLDRLAQSELRIAPDARIVLGWLSSSGERIELTQSLPALLSAPSPAPLPAQ
jgi:hypothetical protein